MSAREVFPAPRETDCEYGCCKAGDEGFRSDAQGIEERRAFSLATSEAAERFDERDQEMSWVWLCAKVYFAHAAYRRWQGHEEALRRRLLRYTSHEHTCPARTAEGLAGPCNCGLQEALYG